MRFKCKRCGDNYETDDLFIFFCEKCTKKIKEIPNEKIQIEVREADKRGMTYGEWMDKKVQGRYL